MPRLEVLWWEGCPSTERAVAELQAAAAAVGLDEAEIALREIRSEQEAAEAGFVGSPTILIDGIDPLPAPGEPSGLTCRIYRRRGGRISPTPDPDDLRTALAAAAARQEVNPSP